MVLQLNLKIWKYLLQRILDIVRSQKCPVFCLDAINIAEAILLITGSNLFLFKLSILGGLQESRVVCKIALTAETTGVKIEKPALKHCMHSDFFLDSSLPCEIFNITHSAAEVS